VVQLGTAVDSRREQMVVLVADKQDIEPHPVQNRTVLKLLKHKLQLFQLSVGNNSDLMEVLVEIHISQVVEAVLVEMD
jgi:hypothetical protein